MDAMNKDEYLAYLREAKEVGESQGIQWQRHSLRPRLALDQSVIGWDFRWSGSFQTNHIIDIKEDWSGTEYASKRIFFSYHYGPSIEINGKDRAQPKTVIARLDGVNYNGRGFHIHCNAPEPRIYQDELTTPIFDEINLLDFLNCVIKVRRGASVESSFELRRI